MGGYLARLRKTLRIKLIICRYGRERLAEHISCIRTFGAPIDTTFSQHCGDHRVLVSGWGEREERAIRDI